MSIDTILPLAMVLSLLLLLFSGYPVALVLIGVTMLFTGVALSLGYMDVDMLQVFPMRTFGVFADNLLLPAVAPLLFMGIALQKSGIAKDMFLSISTLLRRVPGNTYLAVLFMGVILAPAAGLIGAAVAMLSLATVPAMLSLNNDKKLATASVAVAGTVGTIIPPAVMLFFLADLMQTTVLGAFGGVVYPVALLLALYSVYFITRGYFERVGSRGSQNAAALNHDIRIGQLLGKLILPFSLIVMVLGSIISGIATPTHAASVGAAGAFLLMAINQSMTIARLREVLIETGLTVAMVFFVIIAANAFSLIFRLLDGDALFPNFLAWLQFGDWGALIFILSTIFILGFFIDWIEIVVITLPIFAPVIAGLDFGDHVGDPLMTRIWIMTSIAVVLQTSFLTPPFGFALFFVRGTVPPEIAMSDIYKGVLPLILIQIFVIGVVLLFPMMATRLSMQLLN
jgi:tripartite ATP-independent transporter DctM subunit